jgi:hypothetical protein
MQLIVVNCIKNIPSLMTIKFGLGNILKDKNFVLLRKIYSNNTPFPPVGLTSGRAMSCGALVENRWSRRYNHLND